MKALELCTDPLWDVRLEMLKDFRYNFKGQFIDEVVQAPDKEAAKLKALHHNEMAQEHIGIEVKILSAVQWTDNG